MQVDTHIAAGRFGSSKVSVLLQDTAGEAEHRPKGHCFPSTKETLIKHPSACCPAGCSVYLQHVLPVSGGLNIGQLALE